MTTTFAGSLENLGPDQLEGFRPRQRAKDVHLQTSVPANARIENWGRLALQDQGSIRSRPESAHGGAAGIIVRVAFAPKNYYGGGKRDILHLTSAVNDMGIPRSVGHKIVLSDHSESGVASAPAVTQALSEIERITRSSSSDEALDYVYAYVDCLVDSGDIRTLNHLFREANADRLSIAVALGLLTATLPVKWRLRERRRFRKRLANRLNREERSVQRLLSGL